MAEYRVRHEPVQTGQIADKRLVLQGFVDTKLEAVLDFARAVAGVFEL